MSRNGAGIYTLNTAGQPVVSGTTITSNAFNLAMNDIAMALTDSIASDGQTTTSGIIPFAAGISLSGGTPLSTFTEGTFTPTDQSGAALSLTIYRAQYSQIGHRVFVELCFAYPVTGDGSASVIGLGALPACANVVGVAGNFLIFFGGAVFLQGVMVPNTDTFGIYDSTFSAQHNAGLSGSTIRCQFNYSTV